MHVYIQACVYNGVSRTKLGRHRLGAGPPALFTSTLTHSVSVWYGRHLPRYKQTVFVTVWSVSRLQCIPPSTDHITVNFISCELYQSVYNQFERTINV